MKTTLVIMAAGMGSRFSGGIKQLTPIGPSGEIMIDYSVCDAIEAGFNKIVFVIRKEIEQDFLDIIGYRMERCCRRIGVEVAYAFQSVDDLPGGHIAPAGRTKPWGTGQAVLCCKEHLDTPFAIINADDYYGKEAYVKIHDFLTADALTNPTALCMAGFLLKNTLSQNGGVTRGICQITPDGYVTDIKETKNIVPTADGAASGDIPLDLQSHVSMNMWGMPAAFLQRLEQGFLEFLDDADTDPEQAEYLLPVFIGQLLQKQEICVKMLSTNDKWFGVTYSEDRQLAIQAIRQLIECGVYRSPLFQ